MAEVKRAIVIYDTRFGNTEKVARALAKGMEEQEVGADCLEVGEVNINKLVEYDFLAVGGPTHIHGVSRPMKAFLEELRSVDIAGKKGFAFDTKIESWWAGSAAKGIEKRLRKLGVKIVRSRESAIVKGREGPLEDGTEETFKQIGTEIARSL